MDLEYDHMGRPFAASGETGPDSTRDRDVYLEISMGELGCGDLIYELKLQFSRVSKGKLVRIVTNDPGAPIELPSWCQMTGHQLLESDSPFYIIQARNRAKGECNVG